MKVLFVCTGNTCRSPMAQAIMQRKAKEQGLDIEADSAAMMMTYGESMNPKAGATDGEQEYTLTIHIEGLEEPFVRPLPNLKTLFRNTHVVVNITLKYSDEIIVDVIPYSEVKLEPEFGL